MCRKKSRQKFQERFQLTFQAKGFKLKRSKWTVKPKGWKQRFQQKEFQIRGQESTKSPVKALSQNAKFKGVGYFCDFCVIRLIFETWGIKVERDTHTHTMFERSPDRLRLTLRQDQGVAIHRSRSKRTEMIIQSMKLHIWSSMISLFKSSNHKQNHRTDFGRQELLVLWAGDLDSEEPGKFLVKTAELQANLFLSMCLSRIIHK